MAMDRRIRHHLARARAAVLGGATPHRHPLAPRIADHTAAFAKIYADKAVACRVSVAPDVAVACDSQDLDEMVGNLLDNAFKWCRSTVQVSAAAEPGAVRLAVEDDGPGVAADQLAAILKPGQRLDEQVSGDGFGLAIVQELTELYGGAVTLSPSPLGGLHVTLTLPLSSGTARVPAV